MLTEPRVAIVHDALINTGGAERAVTYMCEAFPDAPVYTSVYLPDRTHPEFGGRDVRPLVRTPRASERHARRLFPLWMLGFRRLRLQGFDRVLSSTSFPVFGAAQVRVPPDVPHICYCHRPTRWVWAPAAYSEHSVPVGRAVARVAGLTRPLLRRRETRLMRAVSRLVTNCNHMAAETARCYNRTPEVLNLPVRVADFPLGDGSGAYYLVVSRLVSWKRVDLAIEACKRLGRPLVVAGDGLERSALETLASGRARFLGSIADRAALGRLYAGCRALLFPSLEDYGLAPLEAQAAGRPVIAYGKGGVLETIVPGTTGLLFDEQTADSLAGAIQCFERMSFSPESIREHARRFDVDVFTERLRRVVLEP